MLLRFYNNVFNLWILKIFMVNRFGPGTGRDEEGNPVLYERLNYQSGMLYNVRVRRAIEYAIRIAKRSGLHQIQDFYIEFGINEELGRSLHEVSDKVRITERDLSFSNDVIRELKNAEKFASQRKAIEVGLTDLAEAFVVK